MTLFHDEKRQDEPLKGTPRIIDHVPKTLRFCNVVLSMALEI